MKYKCWNCNKVFDEDEMKTRTEHEEFWGAMVPVYYNCCPGCREDITDEDEITCDSCKWCHANCEDPSQSCDMEDRICDDYEEYKEEEGNENED